MHYLQLLKTERKTMGSYSRNLRLEEKKCARRMSYKGADMDYLGSVLSDLFKTRTINRFMSRHAHLAHAYIKGMAYRVAENSAKVEPNAMEIAEYVKDFGYPEQRNRTLQDNMEQVQKWLSA